MTDQQSTRHGVEAWTSPTWLADAVSWLDQGLRAAGLARTGTVEQPRVRPWATVLRAPTTGGPVWMKAAGPGTAFEVGLYEVLNQIVPNRVLSPLAVDRRRGWVLLPDGGQSIGERLAGADVAEALATALTCYGQLQRDVAPHVDDLRDVGVSDMTPGVMLGRFDQALEATDSALRGPAQDSDRAILAEVAAMRQTFGMWCEQLAGSQLPASVDHNDLHPWNVLGGGSDDASDTVRFYDWGDAVIAHPFAAMLMPLGFLRELLGDGPQLLRARDAYLEGFADQAPGEDLPATMRLACRVAKVARALTWDRALRAAREQGEEIAEDWSTAPLEALASVLDESYLIA